MPLWFNRLCDDDWAHSVLPSFPGPHNPLDPFLTIIIKLVTMQQCVTKPPVLL